MTLQTSFRQILLLAAALLVSAVSYAEVPAEYYSTINDKRGQDLKNALHELTKHHSVVSYSSLWYHFPFTDCYPDNPSRVWDMYSNRNYYFRSSGSSVSGMNREHSLPKSWWGGDVVDAYTDLNHLYPSDAEANTAKLNWPLGEVSSVQFNNGVSKTGTPKAGQGGGASVVFEPADEYKGDFARTYFYMATCYQDYQWKYKYMLTESSWMTLNPWSIDMLLRWAREDPVSDKEIARNEAVYKIQNNRNPFIDYPQLMEYIWGDHYGDAFDVEGYVDDDDDPDKTPRLITPTPGTSIEMGDIAIGKSTSLTVYVKGKHIKSSLSVLLYRDDYKMFSIPVSSISRGNALSEDGYPLVVSYTPTAIGNHKCRLLISDGGMTGSYGVEITANCREIPSLTTLSGLRATKHGEDRGTYELAWNEPAEPVEYYIVTRTIYNEHNSIVSSGEYMTDECTYTFEDLEPGQSHTLSVQSYLLGYRSPMSNVVTVSTTGIDDVIAGKPIAFLYAPGAVIIKCSEPILNVDIFTISGKLARHYDRIDNDQTINLPQGVYVLRQAGSTTATKLIVR